RDDERHPPPRPELHVGVEDAGVRSREPSKMELRAPTGVSEPRFRRSERSERADPMRLAPLISTQRGVEDAGVRSRVDPIGAPSTNRSIPASGGPEEAGARSEAKPNEAHEARATHEQSSPNDALVNLHRLDCNPRPRVRLDHARPRSDSEPPPRIGLLE